MGYYVPKSLSKNNAHPTTADQAPRRAIGYVRVSMAREEMISPEIQQDAIIEWCKRKDRVLLRVLADLDRTGTNFARANVQAAIAAVERGEADEVVCWKFSRFGRHRHGWALNLHRIESVGGALYSATEDVDPFTSTGRFTRGMLAEIAAWESERTGEQWQEALARRIEAGLPKNGRERFGYTYHRCGRTTSPCTPDGCNTEFRVHPVNGPVLADLYRRYLDGEGIASLAAWCAKTGQHRERGGQWTTSSVTDLLDGGFGAGLIKEGGHKVGEPGKWREVPVRYLPGSQQAVTTWDEWQRYQTRRRSQARVPSAAKSSPWPLTGLILCGKCGATMVAASSARGRGYIYRCSKMQGNRTCSGLWRVRSAIEEAVFDRLDGLADRLEEAARVAVVGLAGRPRPVDTERSSVEQRIADVKRQVSRLVASVASGALSPEDVGALRIALAEQQVEQQAALDQIDGPRKDVGPAQIRTLRSQWDLLPVETRREMMRLLVREVVVLTDKTIAVTLWSN